MSLISACGAPLLSTLPNPNASSTSITVHFAHEHTNVILPAPRLHYPLKPPSPVAVSLPLPLLLHFSPNGYDDLPLWYCVVLSNRLLRPSTATTTFLSHPLSFSPTGSSELFSMDAGSLIATIYLTLTLSPLPGPCHVTLAG